MTTKISRQQVLNTLIKHETLKITDIIDPVNIGAKPEPGHLQKILDELVASGLVTTLDGADPLTYTITEKGIEEGARG